MQYDGKSLASALVARKAQILRMPERSLLWLDLHLSALACSRYELMYLISYLLHLAWRKE
jgi:hypothetical protein